MSAISSQDIISILKEEIENYDFEAKDREIGHVIWVGDGIATGFFIVFFILSTSFLVSCTGFFLQLVLLL